MRIYLIFHLIWYFELNYLYSLKRGWNPLYNLLALVIQVRYCKTPSYPIFCDTYRLCREGFSGTPQSPLILHYSQCFFLFFLYLLLLFLFLIIYFFCIYFLFLFIFIFFFCILFTHNVHRCSVVTHCGFNTLMSCNWSYVCNTKK